MDGHRSPFHAALPLGSWAGVRVQLSLWFPVLALIFWWKFPLQLGTLLVFLLFFSVLIHEVFHVIAARWTGGTADEILLWPAGGLVNARPEPTFRSEFLTAAAGPAANLLVCLAMLPAIGRAGTFPAGLLHPFELVDVDLGSNLWHGIALLAFDLNWLLLLLNLVPVYPLDGGRMLLTALTFKWLDAETARFAALRIGMAIGLGCAVLGLMLDLIWLVFAGFLVFCMDLYEFFMLQLSEQLDDSFLGYDFSQGYTSLERSQARERERRPGLIQRWRMRRAAKKREREEQERLETERRLDELLEKVHREGMNSLSDAERRFLQKASTRYRSGDRKSES